jgi:hypothetical protein
MSRPLQLAWLGGLLTILGHTFATCICGHISWEGLLGTAPGAGLAWWGFAINSDKRSLPRAGLWVVVTLTSFMLLRNLHNVLWSGHDPLLH